MRQSAFHPSLNRPKLVMGIGTKAWMLVAGVGALAFNFQQIFLAVVAAGLFAFLRWTYRQDALALEAYIRYQREADMYDPWIRREVILKRPHGLGRGLLC